MIASFRETLGRGVDGLFLVMAAGCLAALILVCLGVEVLLASRSGGKIRYDWVGMVLCFVLVTAALVFFGIAWCLVYRPETVICY